MSTYVSTSDVVYHQAERDDDFDGYIEVARSSEEVIVRILFSKHHPGIGRQGPGKTTKNLSQDNQYPGQDWKRVCST
jgi:hypothetical protein